MRAAQVTHCSYLGSPLFEVTVVQIDDLRKSRGLYSVSAYGHGLEYNYRSMLAGVAQSRHAFVGGTVSTAWER